MIWSDLHAGCITKGSSDMTRHGNVRCFESGSSELHFRVAVPTNSALSMYSGTCQIVPKAPLLKRSSKTAVGGNQFSDW